MATELGNYGGAFQYPMTEKFFVGLYQDYEWDEGKVFQHDETGLYTFITESGCSCNHFLSWVSNKEEFERGLVWSSLEYLSPDVLRYIESDGGRYDANGPDWVVSEKARWIAFLKG